MKVYKRLAEAFFAEGVTTTFGMMGDGCMYWLQEMHRSGVDVVEVRHEGAGLGMADGYARASGEPGVCHVTSGPGLTQLATALVTAARANSPVVVFAAEHAVNDPEHAQYLDQKKFVEGCESGFVRLALAEQADEAVRKAFQMARTLRKPIVLSCPQDIQQVDFEFDDPYSSQKESYRSHRVKPMDESLERAAQLIITSQRPVIIAGRGAQLSDAGAEILALADRIGALITTSLVAQTFLGEYDYHAGISGLYATRTAIELLESADLVIGIGASLNRYTLENGYLYQNAKFIQIDCKSALIANGKLAEVGLIGDAKTTVEALNRCLEARDHRTSGYRLPDVKERLKRSLDDGVDFPIDEGTVDPRSAIRLLDDLLPQSVGLVKGTGMSNGFTNMLMTKQRRANLAGYAFGCIGQALPAAMGAVIAGGFKATCVIDGDAGVLMHLAEFETAVRYKMPLLVVVLNNESVGAEYYKMKVRDMDSSMALISTPDLGSVARSLGGVGSLVTDLDQLPAIIGAFVANSAPTLIDLRISRSVPSIPYRRLQYAEDI